MQENIGQWEGEDNLRNYDMVRRMLRSEKERGKERSAYMGSSNTVTRLLFEKHS